MKNFFFTTPGIFKMGFSNQIFSFITAIIVAMRDNKKILFVESFSRDFIDSRKRIKIGKLFNLIEINNFLKKYNITIFDRYDSVFSIQNIYEISENNKINYTKFYNKKYNILKNVKITEEITDETEKKDIQEIHFVNESQNKLVVEYKINDIIFEDIYEPNEKIVYNFVEAFYHNHFGLMNSYNLELFEEILQNIIYNKLFFTFVEDFLRPILITGKEINVLHLRVEPDALCHWSLMNKMEADIFKDYIEKKYIDLITKYLDKDSENIILSYSQNNSIVDFMRKSGYNIHYIDKSLFDGRELNAVFDLLIGTACNNVFIGNFNLENLNGSTFSYYLSKVLPKEIKRIMIDLDNITDEEHIYTDSTL